MRLIQSEATVLYYIVYLSRESHLGGSSTVYSYKHIMRFQTYNVPCSFNDNYLIDVAIYFSLAGNEI